MWSTESLFSLSSSDAFSSNADTVICDMDLGVEHVEYSNDIVRLSTIPEWLLWLFEESSQSLLINSFRSLGGEGLPILVPGEEYFFCVDPGKEYFASA